jgi:hypothetical protein
MGVYGKGSVGGAHVIPEQAQASFAADKIVHFPIAWETVAAALNTAIEINGWRVEAGERFLRHGTVMVEVTESQGMFGAYDPNATDGRQAPQIGRAFILDELVREYDQNAAVGKMFDAGTAHRNRLLIGNDGQLSWEEFAALFPAIEFADES